MDRPKFHGAVEDGEYERAAEGSDQVAEVPSPEFSLALHTQSDNASIRRQYPDAEHVAEHSVADFHRQRTTWNLLPPANG
jgi:hypothetical protein